VEISFSLGRPLISASTTRRVIGPGSSRNLFQSATNAAILDAVGSLLRKTAQTRQAVAAVFRTRDLRRLLLAWVGSVIGTWAYTIALAVYAYTEGGAVAVGVLGVIRLVPSAVAAPFITVLVDRFPRARVMLVTDLIRAPLMVIAALTIYFDGPLALVFAAAGVSNVVGTAFRPAQAALIPSLARTPQELSAANVASSTVESVGSLMGPALGGILLAVTSPEIVVGVNAVSFLWSSLMVAGISAVPVQRSARGERPRFRSEAAAGFRTIAAEPPLRLVAAVYAAQTVVAGAYTVLVVAASIELLDMGESGFGFLNAAVGVGGVVGGLIALTLAARQRLAVDFALGVALYGAPLAALVLWQEPAVALLFMCVIGIGNTLTDVSALTLLQRAVPDEVLGRAFGALESMLLGSIAVGAVVSPILVETIGIEAALVAVGIFLPAVVLLALPRLTRLDVQARVPAQRIALLEAHPIFAPLPEPTLEYLAAKLEPRSVAAGEVVFREGDHGDQFFLVETGQVEVDLGTTVATIGPGDGFGEIALLNDVPRTATVTARTDATLLALEREEFLETVAGDRYSTAAAEDVVAGRLGSLSPGIA
jgi:MFS family permease